MVATCASWWYRRFNDDSMYQFNCNIPFDDGDDGMAMECMEHVWARSICSPVIGFCLRSQSKWRAPSRETWHYMAIGFHWQFSWTSGLWRWGTTHGPEEEWSVWSWMLIAAKKTAGDESIGIRFVWDEPVWSGLIIYSIGWELKFPLDWTLLAENTGQRTE